MIVKRQGNNPMPKKPGMIEDRNSLLMQSELQLKVYNMKTVTMLEFRRNSAGVLKRLSKGEPLILSHRGKPAARLEPISSPNTGVQPDDPALSLSRFAVNGPGGKFTSKDVDRLLYGHP